MPTLDEFVNDKGRYPDDMKITLAEGVEATLGQLRSSTLMERDYRHKTMKLSQDRKAFDEDRVAWEQARLDAEAKLTELAKSMLEKRPESTRDEVEDLLERDPVAKRLTDRISKLESKIQEAHVKEEEILQRQRYQEEMYIADQHRRVLSQLQARDKDLNPEELINFAKSRYIARLDDAYVAMNHEKMVSSAVKEAEEKALQKGYDKAKKELLQPVITPTRTLMGSDTPGTAAKSFDEAYSNAMKDPEIITMITGGSAS